MDFYHIKEKPLKGGGIELYPDFQVGRSKDLMVRGGAFYAIWDEAKGEWSTDEYDVVRLVDAELYARKDELIAKGVDVHVRSLSDMSSNCWSSFKYFVKHLPDCSVQLDEKVVFSNTPVTRKDYTSKRLPYPLEAGDYSAYDELMTTLYHEEERAKIEWAIGAVVAGDAKDIQKFVVLYGESGTGKSTVLNIIQKLFDGYYTVFEARALAVSGNTFSMEMFRSNPLVAIQHDGDLSKIEDNTKLNSIISHEVMLINEKFKAPYPAKVNSFLFMGTNKPVKITDAKSGIIRRLLDVRPSGDRVSVDVYNTLYSQIDFELGAIAAHCLEVYRGMGKNYYRGYRPVDMMFQTDVFFNYIEEHMDIFMDQDGISLKQAYELYKVYCENTNLPYVMAQYQFREELKDYFDSFEDRVQLNGQRFRSYYTGFKVKKFSSSTAEVLKPFVALSIDNPDSMIDDIYADMPAQYANDSGTPQSRWANVNTVLSDLDTSRLHYVKLPQSHIVIDFDLKDETGEKSAELNLRAATGWPTTYAEWSKSGAGIHLHYIYEGDTEELAREFSDGIEVKVFTGDSALRRIRTKSNGVPIAKISSGLPIKEKKVINTDTVMSERGIRDLIIRNLNKEIHSGTKPSVDFIHKILEEAYSSGQPYDVTDLRPKVLAFALGSSNQADTCLKLVGSMRFASEDASLGSDKYADEKLVFFDCEVFPNLFVVCWKFEDSKNVVRLINPTSQQIEELLAFKLVGFNCRNYDNHILYGRWMGYSNAESYAQSQKIIGNNRSAYFGEAYNLSYVDIYDYSSKKQSLKKFQIDLGLNHQELGYPWDQPVPEDKWELVADYCENDVRTTEAVHIARHEDFNARLILADLSGLPVNCTTQKHTAQIIFGKDKNPQAKFNCPDLSKEFEGYVYDYGKSSYRGEDPGEGGLVRAQPGIYRSVALLDVRSMHPRSIELLDLFGPYTRNYSDLVRARLAIKAGDLAEAGNLLGGRLLPYLGAGADLKALSYALKIVINIVYGLTSAKFENPFRDPRNKDNVVAKRGSLFMIDLMKFVESKGFTVAHIKTDSIKIPDATPEIISEVFAFGEKYGYTFEHETTYEKMCLVNDAVYIAKDEEGWHAVGAQFAEPYVFKTLFTGEDITFNDVCLSKTVTTALYLDLNEDLPEGEHNRIFVGRAGRFTPVRPGCGGGVLEREKDGNYHAASGTKGYRWREAEMVQALEWEDEIDFSYFETLVDNARTAISKFGDVDQFTR